MSVILRCYQGGYFHEHNSLESASHCWGDQSLYVMGTGHPKAPAEHAVKALAPTEAQLSYVAGLGGSRPDAELLSRNSCSALIDDLRRGRGPKLPPPGTPLDDAAWEPFPEMVRYLLDNPPEEKEESDLPVIAVAKRETKVPLELLDKVPDGYYATQLEEGAPVVFLRVSRPTRGKLAGALKVQQQQGTGIGIRLVDGMVVWPPLSSGRRRVDIYRVSLEEAILLLIIDYHGAARLYAKERRQCARCNADLTDARSRKYGIGPECEKHWPWMIDAVDMEEEE